MFLKLFYYLWQMCSQNISEDLIKTNKMLRILSVGLVAIVLSILLVDFNLSKKISKSQKAIIELQQRIQQLPIGK